MKSTSSSLQGKTSRGGIDASDWLVNRLSRERAFQEKLSKPFHRSGVFGFGCLAAYWLLKCTGLYKRGRRNALNVTLSEVKFYFDDLPRAFDGYRILHLSDLHVETLPENAEQVARVVADLKVDLCVNTGDYLGKDLEELEVPVSAMRKIMSRIHAVDGTVSVLGNHDTHALISPLEEIGIRVLINESILISRNGEQFTITGLDDIQYYSTPLSMSALQRAPAGFKLLLVHSPGFEEEALLNDFSFYLCGHTHGGQIALPGGRPIALQLSKSRRRSARGSGSWRFGILQGYTSRGAGVSVLPIRFNCDPEVSLITLHRTDMHPSNR